MVNYPYTTIGASYFANEETSDVPPLNTNQLAFSTGLSSFYSPNYIFLPTWVSGSVTYTSSLYSRYGDIDYPFQLGVFDIFSSYDISGSYFETRIADVQIVTGSVTPSNQYVLLTFVDEVPSGSKLQLENLSATQNKPTTFLFLKRVPDETNAYLKFTKRPGQTSYGFLIPEKENRKILGTIWSSALFPNRSPNDCIAITTFVGGARQPEMCELDDEELQNVVLKELNAIMGINGKPHFVKINRWRKAIPQYELGYFKTEQAIEKFEQNFRGAFLCANFRGGISVVDCVMSGEKVARKILEQT